MDYYQEGFDRGYEAAQNDEIYGTDENPSDISFDTTDEYDDYCRGYRQGISAGRRDKGMGIDQSEDK